MQSFLDLPDPANNPRCFPVSDTARALGLPQPADSSTWTAINACLLVFMLIAIRMLTYIALRRKTTQL